MPADDKLLDLVLGDVLDVRAAGIEHVDFVRVGVESGDFVAGFGKAQSQRQANVAAADDSYFELGAFEELGFSFDGHGSSRTPVNLTSSNRSQPSRVFLDSPKPAEYPTTTAEIGATRQRNVNIAVSRRNKKMFSGWSVSFYYRRLPRAPGQGKIESARRRCL